MKQLIMSVIILSSLMLMSACGGGGSSSDEPGGEIKAKKLTVSLTNIDARRISSGDSVDDINLEGLNSGELVLNGN